MHLVVGLFWGASFQRNCSIWVGKMLQTVPQIGHLSWPSAPDEPSHLQPWVNMVAQVVPNGAQSGSKGVQRVPK